MPRTLEEVYAAMEVSQVAAHPLRCYRYILEVLSQLLRENPDSARRPGEICAFFRSRIRSDFGALAPEVLSQWEFHSGRELGAALLALADFGCLSKDEEDKLEEYAAAGSLLSI